MIYDIELNSAAHYPVAGIVELAPLIEQAGFGAFWKGESNSTDPLVLLSGIAARTKNLKLGTAIYHIYGRSAVTLGIQSATLQDLSGGRLLLGLGVANKTIAGWHGGTFDRPLRRIREYMEIVRKTAAGERMEYKGEIYNTGQRFQLSWKPEHPHFPIYLAGLGPKMTHLTGEISDGVFINMAIPSTIRAIAARVREGAAAAGRDPSKIEIITKVRVSLHPDRVVARSRLRQVLTFYNIADHYRDMLIASGFETEVNAVQEAFKAGGFKAAQEQITDAYMDKLPVIPGTSIGEIRERLKPFGEAGATRLVVPYVPVAEPVIEDARRFVEAWGRFSGMIYDIQINPVGDVYPSAGVVELAPLMEQAGFGAFWKGEANNTDPLVLCCAIAARTPRLQVGTGIYHIYGRSAVTMGIQAATLQDMSGGRFLLGLGVANKTIAAWHGGTFDRPLRRIREYSEIVRKVAAGERVEYKGEMYETGSRFQLSWKPSHPSFPIYFAGLGPKMTRLAGEIADGVIVNMAPSSQVGVIASRVREGAVAAGRDPANAAIIAKVSVSVHPDRAVARARLRQTVTFYSIADHYRDMLTEAGLGEDITRIQQAFRQGGFKAAQEQVTDAYMDQMPAIAATSVAEVRERLRAFEQAGVTRLIIPYVPATDPVIDDARRFLEAWGNNS